jgi:hypothetical protein
MIFIAFVSLIQPGFQAMKNYTRHDGSSIFNWTCHAPDGNAKSPPGGLKKINPYTNEVSHLITD